MSQNASAQFPLMVAALRSLRTFAADGGGNPEHGNCDTVLVTCEFYMAALSARADGEDPGINERVLDAHVEGCADCHRFDDSIGATRRAAVVASAPPIPDISKRVARLTAAEDRAGSWNIPRWLLLIVAIQVAAFALPELLGSNHPSRHLGAFSLAYAGGLVMVVVRPARARTMLAVAAVLVASLLVTAIVDAAQGRTPLVYETSYIPEVLSVLLLWLLARPDRDSVADPLRSVTQPGLQLVTDDADERRKAAEKQHPSNHTDRPVDRG